MDRTPAGAKGFPNLRDGDWLYGGEPGDDQGKHHQRAQRHHAAVGAVLGDDGVKNVANYVRSLSGLPHDKLRAELGKPQFMQICAACHGADGKGNQQLGAPNLTDQIWLVWRIRGDDHRDHQQGPWPGVGGDAHACAQGPARPGQDPVAGRLCVGAV